LVVNGKEQFVGSDRTAIRDATARALSRPAQVAVSVETEPRDGALTVRYSTGGAGRVLLQVALVQLRATSAIDAGENDGLSIAHRNVVRDLLERQVDLPIQGEERFMLPVPATPAAFGAVVIVSDATTRVALGVDAVLKAGAPF
jgi:hypothetical protein